MRRYAEYTPIFWFHLIINILLILSWMLFSWWIVILGSLILQLQYMILGGCILSRMEFGKKEDCMVHYLHKWGIIKDRKYAGRFIELHLHIIVILLALIWQISLGIEPLMF